MFDFHIGEQMEARDSFTCSPSGVFVGTGLRAIRHCPCPGRSSETLPCPTLQFPDGGGETQGLHTCLSAHKLIHEGTGPVIVEDELDLICRCRKELRF